MKKLEKIRLNEAVSILDEYEMKLLTGGTSFYCIRLQDDGKGWGTFTTDSPELAAAWANTWNAFSDWHADCRIQYNSPYIYV